MSKLDILITEFCVPLENDKICEDLCDIADGWCGKNCGTTNNGQYPEKNCYKHWLKLKKKEIKQRRKCKT